MPKENRVTDQETQNALISKFNLEGLLKELDVASTILPVVTVASLQSALTVGEFEKWRSVFQGGPPLIDAASFFKSAVIAFATGIDTVLAFEGAQSTFGSAFTGQHWGCKLPGGDVGVPATDGVYRITLWGAGAAATTRMSGEVHLRDQAAFGSPVAIGTSRGNLGNWHLVQQGGAPFLAFDAFVTIRTTDNANAIVFNSNFGVSSTAVFSLFVRKLIDEIPPNQIFP